MAKGLLLLASFALLFLAIPTASAGPLTCVAGPAARTTCIPAGVVNYAYDVAFCLPNTAPVDWVACVLPGNGMPGYLIDYALCFADKGALHWVDECILGPP